jgi:hypothetical protein
LGELGSVVWIQRFDVNDDGDWTVAVGTDHWLVRQAVLKNGRIFSLWGDPQSTAGLYQGDVNHPQISDHGRISWVGFVEPVIPYLSGSYISGDAVTWTDRKVLAPQVPPDMTYYFHHGLRANDSQVVIACNLDDPAPGVLFHEVLMRFTPVAGQHPAENVIVQQGDVLPGMTGPVVGLPTGTWDFDLNRSNQLLYTTRTSDATHWLYLDQKLLAVEGAPIGTTGLTWALFGSVNLNDAGDWVVSGLVDTALQTNQSAVVRNEQVVVLEGDVLPGTNGYPIKIASVIDLLADGRTLWQGYWPDPDTTRDEGLYLDGVPLVLEGVTLVDGKVLTGLTYGAISDDGDTLLFSGSTGSEADPLFGLYLLELGP